MNMQPYIFFTPVNDQGEMKKAMDTFFEKQNFLDILILKHTVIGQRVLTTIIYIPNK